MKNNHPASEMSVCIRIDGVDEHAGDTGNQLVDGLLHP
jgi:hypothetical protein